MTGARFAPDFRFLPPRFSGLEYKKIKYIRNFLLLVRKRQTQSLPQTTQTTQTMSLKTLTLTTTQGQPPTLTPKEGEPVQVQGL